MLFDARQFGRSQLRLIRTSRSWIRRFGRLLRGQGARLARAAIEELDYCRTPLGELILRRREVLSLDRAEVFEVKLNGQFLMSSLVNATEIALATIAMDSQTGAACDVLVGGLGLGYTAKTALDSPKVRSVTVIEYLARVIGWHQRGLVPLGSQLVSDPRCRLIHGDFFAAIHSRQTNTFQGEESDATPPLPGRFHAVLVDIDHSPHCLLQPRHAAFYTAAGLKRLTDRLHAGGVFALWSAGPPEESFLTDVRAAFCEVEVHESRFFHPLLNEDDVNYIVVARLDDDQPRRHRLRPREADH
jgi:hypothetical protein